MLNSAPINSWPLNALAGGAEPVVIDPPKPPQPPKDGDGIYPGFPVPPPATGHGFRWSVVVMLGGNDISSTLTGSIRIDREEGAAGVAELSLFYPLGVEVKTDLADRSLTIDYITDDGSNAAQVRLFTGAVAEPSWDALSRVMRIIATDGLQQRVEAMSAEQIDSLTKGEWSEDVYRPIEGRSRWDYAQERMASRAASLDCSRTGSIRTTSWYAENRPSFIFGQDTTIYQSISVDLAQLRSVTNRVEVDFSYRYQRLHEASIQLKWIHPGAGGSTGIGGFCNWREMTTELPSVEMVLSATSSAGLTATAASWYLLPESMPDPCGTGAPWINTNRDLLLGANWSASRRWAQTVTEKYKLSLSTTAGLIEGQQVISRVGASVAIDHPDTEDWSNSIIEASQSAPAGGFKPGYGVAGDRADDERRNASLNCLLLVAQTEIIAAHRKTSVSWDVPTSMALAVDLNHTIEIKDQLTHARGKCSRRVDVLDFETGSAITSITVSLMRGIEGDSSLPLPPRTGADDQNNYGGDWGAMINLPTQLGGRFISPSYRDDMDGFSGNYDARQDSTLPVFPRRLAMSAAAVDEQFTAEKQHESEHDYLIGVPNDLLEL